MSTDRPEWEREWIIRDLEEARAEITQLQQYLVSALEQIEDVERSEGGLWYGESRDEAERLRALTVTYSYAKP